MRFDLKGPSKRNKSAIFDKNITTNFTLGKSERVKSRKLIEQLFAKGKTFSTFPLRIIYMIPPKSTSPLQAGFGVSTKKFKRAVDRNKIKRVMKETYRLQKNQLNDVLAIKKISMAIFILYIGNDIPDYRSLYDKMGNVILRLSNVHNVTLLPND